MYQVIDKFAEVAVSVPDPVLPIGKVGWMRPAGSGDLPLLVLSASVSDSRNIGLNRFIRSGDAMVQSTSVVPVRASEDTFSPSHQRLRLAPLPLRRSPESITEEFSEKDVQITNVTSQNNPVPYHFTTNPTRSDEYRIDPIRAEVIFGLPQKEGDLLQVNHWTVSWHNEILGLRASGEVIAEVWADRLAKADEISRKLQRRIYKDVGLLREKGFLKLAPGSVGPVERSLYSPPAVSGFQVWKQTLTYRFTFELEEGGEVSSGIPIKRIDVNMRGPQGEQFRVPRTA